MDVLIDIEVKTIIMIAHRLKTVRSADQILVLNGGKITQRGTHEELGLKVKEGFRRNPLNLQIPEQTLTASDNIAVGGVKVTCVPGIGDIPRGKQFRGWGIAVLCKGEQFKDFAILVCSASNACHVTDVCIVHANQIIEGIIISNGHLTGPVGNNRDADSAKLIHGSIMRRISDFFAACSCGINLKFSCFV